MELGILPISNKQPVGSLEKVHIIAFREPTAVLEKALGNEGLCCEVMRQEDRPEYRGYAAIYRCMLNHASAWERIAGESRPGLVVESDFVPVRGFAGLPIPGDLGRHDFGIAWLYTTAARIYRVTAEGHAEGFSSSLVAYIVTPRSAESLCRLVDLVTSEHGTGYSNFDAGIGPYLERREFTNFLPYRMYGEHGGVPNPEHRAHGNRSVHRADLLYAKLSFLPQYAGIGPGRQLRFHLARIKARAIGIGRLLTGRYLSPLLWFRSPDRLRLFRFAVGRQVKNGVRSPRRFS